MADDMSIEQQGPPREEKVADRWMRRQGIQKSEFAKPTGVLDQMQSGMETPVRNPVEFVKEAYDLFVEKEDLNAGIVRKQRETMEPPPAQVLTLEEKKALLKNGKVNALLATKTDEPFVELVGRSQGRIKEIDAQLDEIFRVLGTYDHFKADLSRQVRVRHQAREVVNLVKFTEQADLLAIKFARESSVQGRSLTSVERQMVDDNQTLKKDVDERMTDLLKESDVFDQVRLRNLKEYKQQMQRDRFAETPSRQNYLRRIERFWAEGKKTLLTGETGTGKTEMIKHASRRLFGTDPEGVTGHQDMSIYELLGKTGFRVQEGDVFRPAPMIRAMTGREGRGLPFLFDEIDRAPNQAVMGIKTILNARPGSKGIRVQTDSAGSFDVGLDYAVAATANIKSEKYTTATELDPAIVRVFDAPMDIDYMPAWEVYDLALATLMDKRGTIPLSEGDAKTAMKNLCDAASWIQDAYQGKKIVTDPRTGAFMEARGQATTGRGASLKKALLEPGRTLDMLKGWPAASIQGRGFEDYLNERIIEFVNNRAYPDEDRYYLTEIFALKGFLKGHQAKELMVNGLTDDVLRRWTGTQRARKEKGAVAKLTADRVAQLDPYKRFKRPSSKEAEELLGEPEEEQQQQGERADVVGSERAKDILGQDFLGVDAVVSMDNKLKMLGIAVEFDLGNIPDIPYDQKDLEIAKQNGEMLVLRVENMKLDGRLAPINMIDFRELFKRDPMGGTEPLIYSFRPGANDWYKDEDFAKRAGETHLGWALVKKDVLQGSTSKTWTQQEDVLKQYKDGLQRNGATHTDVKRRTPTEAMWDTMLHYTNTSSRLLPDKYDWTATRSLDGELVFVGYFSDGLLVNDSHPEGSPMLSSACVLLGSFIGS